MAKKLTAGTKNALEVLKGFEDYKTLADLNDASELKVASAQLTSLIKEGLAEAIDVEVEYVAKKKVKAYKVTDAGMDFVIGVEDTE